MKNALRRALLVGSYLLGLLLLSGSALAATSDLSRSYDTQGDVQPGNIVSLTSLSSKTVVLANTTNSDRIIGVAVAPEGSLIVINPDVTKVQVTTSGISDVYVSDVNGAIKIGDKVAVSPFDGIGMKSSSGERVIGIAQTAFTDGSSSAMTREVTSKSGVRKTIHIAKVQIQVVIGTDDTTDLRNLNGLQRTVKSLTGRVVPTIRIVLSMIIALVTLVGLTAIIYSAVYGSITSIGRNPLARASIFRALRQAVLIAVAVLFAAFVFIFFLLR